MPVSDAPWWWSPEEVAGAITVVPIHSDCDPVSGPEMAAAGSCRWSARCHRRAARPGSGEGSSLGHRFQGERDGIDAPALVGGHLVTLALEHVPEVGVATGAPDLGSGHAQRAVLDQHHSVAAGRLVETRPAAVGLELLPRPEELGAARPAAVHALGLGIGIFAGPGRLRARLAQHLILLGGEPLPPFRFRSLDFVHVPETTGGPDTDTVDTVDPRRTPCSG